MVQWAMAYLAGAFVLVQALEVLEGPWSLPPRLVQAVHVLLGAGFFLALVVAWYHGERGQQRATQAELIIVTLLLIITGAVIRVVWGVGGSEDNVSVESQRAEVGGREAGIGGSIGRLRAYRFTLPGPSEGTLLHPDDQGFTLSPDGAALVYRWPREGGGWDLRLRRLDSFESHSLRGTEEAEEPFFSPDGQWVGFSREGALYKVAVAGGAPQFIAATGRVRRVRWMADDTLYFSAPPPMEVQARLQMPYGLFEALWKMSADGGDAIPLRTDLLIPGRLEYHGHPEPVPGGRWLVYSASTSTVHESTSSVSDIRVLDRVSGEDRVLIPGATGPRILHTGHLLYVFQGDLYVRPFDARTLDLGADPILVAEGVVQLGRRVRYDVSEEGTLVYVPGGELERESAWFLVDPDDPSHPNEIPSTRLAYNHVAFSPQGTHLAYTRPENGWHVAFVYDLRRGVERAISHPEGDAWGPHWFPDGQRLAFGQGIGGEPGVLLYWAWADGRGPPELIGVPGTNQTVNQITSEGTVVFKQTTPQIQRDIVEVDPSTGQYETLVGGPHDQTQGALSPDRTWIAYASSETGRWEVYARKVSLDSLPQQVSVNGGLAPLWSASGDRLFYRSLDGDTVWSAFRLTSPSGTDFSLPVAALTGEYELGGGINQRGYDLVSDGRFALRMTIGDYPLIQEWRVVVGWDVELGRRDTEQAGR